MAVRAAIDVGSNSVKLLVLEMGEEGTYRVLHDESRVTGLGKGVRSTSKLDPGAAADTLDTLRSMLEITGKFGVGAIRAAGTSALREAADGRDFAARVKRELGIELEILDGAEEARLSRAAALAELPAGARDVVFFDVGGGSTELTWYRDGVVQSDVSLELGARRCTEAAALNHPVAAEAEQRLIELIRNALSTKAPGCASSRENDDPTLQLAGLGGTASTLVWMLRGLREEAPGDPHGAVVGRDELHELRMSIAGLEPEQLLKHPNLDPKRAGVIYAGLAIIEEILHHYQADQFLLVDRGLRFGLLLA